LPSYDRALHALRTWLDAWSGIGRIAVGMAHLGLDIQLTRYDERSWRATFYTTGWSIRHERDRHRVGARPGTVGVTVCYVSAWTRATRKHAA
jgi:hypothetical protein